MSKPLDFEIEEFIEQLRGTCKTIFELLPEGMGEEDLTKEDLQAIDEEIFRCESCSWWCDKTDESEDGENCTDCNPEEE